MEQLALNTLKLFISDLSFVIVVSAVTALSCKQKGKRKTTCIIRSGKILEKISGQVPIRAIIEMSSYKQDRRVLKTKHDKFLEISMMSS